MDAREALRELLTNWREIEAQVNLAYADKTSEEREQIVRAVMNRELKIRNA